MEDKSRVTLDLFRADEKLSWVRDQLIDSFTEGITQSAKDRSEVMEIQRQFAEIEMSPRERTKREKYETSRPYEEVEKVELIRSALHEVFVTVPAIQMAATASLLDLGAETTSIEFSAPDEEERVEGAYTHLLAMEPATAENLKLRFNAFIEKLAS